MFVFLMVTPRLRRNPHPQEQTQLSPPKAALHPGSFAPADCDNPIIFKEITVHLRWNILGLAHGRTPCQFSCQISHFQPRHRSHANQGTEKEVQEDTSSSVDGYQGLSLQNQGCHKLLSHPQYLQSSSMKFPSSIQQLLVRLRTLNTCAKICCGLLLGLGLGTSLAAFQNQDLKAHFKT